jgi:hypothetical protein
MRIMVGCPVFKREWVLPHWFDAVETAFREVGVDPEYAFVTTAGDEPTIDCVYSHARKLITTMVPQDREQDCRDWGTARYHEMVGLRNALLAMVRDENPDLFLSLDSDILIQRNLMVNLLESVQQFDAVGGLAHMVEEEYATCPSWGTSGTSGELIRRDSNGVHRVDIIMAIKLMQPQAYRVDYQYNEYGEDIGWSKHCAEQGLILGFDGRLTNKHVMSRDALNKIDPRCCY